MEMVSDRRQSRRVRLYSHWLESAASQRELIMPRYCVLLLLAIATGIFLSGVVLGDEQTDAARKSLDDIRAALAARDLPKAQASLAEVKRLEVEGPVREERDRLEDLTGYVAEFWDSVDRGMQLLQAVDEIMIGDQPVSVVEVGQGTVILRVAGQNREYTRVNIPPKLALTLAERVLKRDAPENQVLFGAFLAVDAKGDRKLARQAWDTAVRAGLDVKHLLPELEAPLPLPTVEIPTLTPVQRAALSEKNWSLRELGAKGWERKTLVGVGQATREGRLQIGLPADDPRYQVVTRRAFSADFQVRLILQDVPSGCRFGWFASEGGESGFGVDLPQGTFVIEFIRKGGAITCKVAGRDAEVQALGEPKARMSGNIGVEAPADAHFTIASYEFAGR